MVWIPTQPSTRVFADMDSLSRLRHTRQAKPFDVIK